MKINCERCSFSFNLTQSNYELCYFEPYCPKCGKFVNENLEDDGDLNAR